MEIKIEEKQNWKPVLIFHCPVIGRALGQGSGGRGFILVLTSFGTSLTLGFLPYQVTTFKDIPNVTFCDLMINTHK